MIVPESVFTGAREFCPRPDRWHSPDIEATEIEVTEAIAAMVRAIQPSNVIETGTYRGHTAYAIGRALALNGRGHLYSIEIDEKFSAEAKIWCRDLPVTIVTGDTLEFTPDWPIDFAWFDSSISIRGSEFRRFHEHMHEQTIVGFHDVGPQHKVFGQVMELVADGLISSPLIIHSPRGACFANVLKHK